jgi:hypothetical protein
MSKIGPTFSDEIIAAGLGGAPCSWGEDGSYLIDRLTDAQKATFLAVLAAHDPTRKPPGRVSTYRVVKRLEAANLIDAADAALNANRALWRRFYTVGSFASDDPDAVAFVKAIGGDPASILAPDGAQ